MRFYIETYGCAANQGNSEELGTVLIERGHTPSSLEDADLVVVNTCVVTERTERNMIKRLRRLQGERLVIAGCLPASMPDAIGDIERRFEVGVLDRSGCQGLAESLPSSPASETISILSQDHRCAVVNISEGCKGNCSYCIVKRARGGLRSRPPEEVAQMVRHRLEEGAVEIQLGSQDASAYGMDIGSSLPRLLDRITEIQGRYRVRVGMMNPATLAPILDDLARSYQNPKVYRFLHLPVQSGSNEVLERMNRFYRAEDFLEIIASFRDEVPDLTLHTDVIVGFPGETEEDFGMTESLINSAQPDKVNVTRFSPRPYTEANKLKDLPDSVKKERSRRLTWQWQKIAALRNERYVGQILPALVTERGKGKTLKARSDNYREIVIRDQLELGSFHNVKIAKANPFYLEGAI